MGGICSRCAKAMTENRLYVIYAPTHKKWREYATGTASLISGNLAGTSPFKLRPSGWRTARISRGSPARPPGSPEATDRGPE